MPRRELRRKIELGLAMVLGLGALIFWYWIHWKMAVERDEHERTWPCASFESYPVRDVPLRCLPGAASSDGRDGGSS